MWKTAECRKMIGRLPKTLEFINTDNFLRKEL